MNARRLIATMVLAAVVTAAAGCGGGGAAPGGGRGRRHGQWRHPAGRDDQLHRLPEPVRGHRVAVVQRLRDGVPPARAVRPEREARGRLGDQLVALVRRAHLDVPPQGRRQVVRRQAAHGRRRRLDGQPDRQVRERARRPRSPPRSRT